MRKLSTYEVILLTHELMKLTRSRKGERFFCLGNMERVFMTLTKKEYTNVIRISVNGDLLVRWTYGNHEPIPTWHLGEIIDKIQEGKPLTN
jgi:hypothetical protein